MIYIIVPTFKRLDETKKFHESVRNFIPSAVLVIVDDACMDEYTEEFAGKDKVVLLKGNGNLWWGGSINKGLEYLSGLSLNNDDIIIFANNDVILPGKMTEIINFVKKNNVIAHPQVMDQDNKIIKSGKRLVSWFPFITRNLLSLDLIERAHFLPTRFLVMTAGIQKETGYASKFLPMYQGDYEFVYRAVRRGVKAYIHGPSRCSVNEKVTGLKNTNITGFKEYFKSLGNIRSANNVLYRYRFAAAFKNPFLSILSVISMTMNSFLRFVINKLKINDIIS